MACPLLHYSTYMYVYRCSCGNTKSSSTKTSRCARATAETPPVWSSCLLVFLSAGPALVFSRARARPPRALPCPDTHSARHGLCMCPGPRPRPKDRHPCHQQGHLLHPPPVGCPPRIGFEHQPAGRRCLALCRRISITTGTVFDRGMGIPRAREETESRLRMHPVDGHLLGQHRRLGHTPLDSNARSAIWKPWSCCGDFKLHFPGAQP